MSSHGYGTNRHTALLTRMRSTVNVGNIRDPDRPTTALDPISSRIWDESTPATRIATIAERQYGIVARRQLLTVAVSASTIARWVKEGHLHRLHRGVYAVGHRNVSLEGRWLAAVLACGPAAALAGISGCQLLGLIRRRWTDAIHVCVPTARSVRWRESSFTGHDRSNLGI